MPTASISAALHEERTDVPRDGDRTLRLCRRAAARGSLPALLNLKKIYHEGTVVPQASGAGR